MNTTRNLAAPTRRLFAPRPAIQAWRSARCFATETFSTPTPPAIPLRGVLDTPDRSYKATNNPTRKDFVVRTRAPVAKERLRRSPKKVEDRDRPFNKEELDVKPGGKARTARLVGVVVSIGKMDKTVKVSVAGQTWNAYLRKVGNHKIPQSRVHTRRTLTNF